jgi:hypothetical protein
MKKVLNNTNVITANIISLSISVLDFKEILQLIVLILSTIVTIIHLVKNIKNRNDGA